MVGKYVENEKISFEKLIGMYEENPEISKIIVQKTKEGMTCRRNKDIIYINTDKESDEIISIIAGSKKVVLEEPEKEKIEENIHIDSEILESLKLFENNEDARVIRRPTANRKQRFTFKNVKMNVNELLAKLDILKKEEPEKFEKVSSNLKDKIREVIEKGKVYISLGLAALALIGIGIGIGVNIDKPDNNKTTNPTEFVETTDEKQTETEDMTKETQNEIDTISEVEEDFIKDYLEAYNEKYGTEYSEAELLVTNLSGTSIYQLDDGRKVTRGNLPYETKELLSQIGEYESVNMYSDVIQVLLPSGTILGTYNISTGEFLYSGNQLDDLKDENFNEPTLEDLGIDSNKLGAAARVLLSRGVEDEQSINERIDDYNNIDEER